MAVGYFSAGHKPIGGELARERKQTVKTEAVPIGAVSRKIDQAIDGNSTSQTNTCASLGFVQVGLHLALPRIGLLSMESTWGQTRRWPL